MIERRCPLIRLQVTEDIDLRAKILPFPNPHGLPGRERKGSGREVGNPVVMAKILVNRVRGNHLSLRAFGRSEYAAHGAVKIVFNSLLTALGI